MTEKSILEELEEISKENNGFLNPYAVVEFAKDPETALHKQFDWDDSTAAKHWRLHQARKLIRVAVIVLPGSEVPTKVFVSLRDDRTQEGGYRAMSDVLNDDDLKTIMLNEARRDMILFINKYKALEHLVGVIEAMEASLGKQMLMPYKKESIHQQVVATG